MSAGPPGQGGQMGGGVTPPTTPTAPGTSSTGGTSNTQQALGALTGNATPGPKGQPNGVSSGSQNLNTGYNQFQPGNGMNSPYRQQSNGPQGGMGFGGQNNDWQQFQQWRQQQQQNTGMNPSNTQFIGNPNQ